MIHQTLRPAGRSIDASRITPPPQAAQKRSHQMNRRKTLTAAAIAVAVLSSPAFAAEPTDALSVEAGRVGRDVLGTTSLSFTLINNGQRRFEWVMVQCALLDAAGVPLATGEEVVQNVAATSRSYGSVPFYSGSGGAWKTPTCRVGPTSPH
jgi:hypothetical protein